MTRWMTFGATMLVVLAAAGSPSEAKSKPSKKESARPLDGRRFVGEMGKEGAKTGKPEEIVFMDGQIQSKAAGAMGFGMAGYQPAADGDALMFQATMAGTGAESLVWMGGVIGKQLSGTASRTRKGKMIERYWVRAKASKGALRQELNAPKEPDIRP